MKLHSIKEWIKNVDGWLSNAEVEFLYQTALKCRPEYEIVEIGSWQGKSAICLAGALEERSGHAMYAVDPHQDSYVHVDMLGKKGISTFDKFSSNIKTAGLENLVTPIVMKSEYAVKEWDRTKKIGFLWIDGDHRYSEVKKDFDLWSPYVAEGGVVAFHDSTYDDVQSFLVREVLPSLQYRNAELRDSILSVTRSDSHTATDTLRTRYIMQVLKIQESLRTIPVPSTLRPGLKKAMKSFLNMVSS
jgi:Methyltransferase domain